MDQSNAPRMFDCHALRDRLFPSRPVVIRSVVTDHFALVSLRTDWDGSQMVRVGTCWEKLRFKA